eukprot:scaffold6039_cov64-Phaeocystis_antarctica.AAC.2
MASRHARGRLRPTRSRDDGRAHMHAHRGSAVALSVFRSVWPVASSCSLPPHGGTQSIRRAAQSHQVCPEVAQEPSWGTVKTAL